MRALTPVGYFYILMTSALMSGKINPLWLDADCAYGLLKLLQALLAAHNKLASVDQALGCTLVGSEAVRHKSQDARDALRALFEPLHADPSRCIHLIFCIDFDHALGSSLTERNTPIAVFSGTFTWAFVSASDNYALLKASAFGKWLYTQLVKRALHLHATRVEAMCWSTLYDMLHGFARALTPVALGFLCAAVAGEGGQWGSAVGRDVHETRMREALRQATLTAPPTLPPPLPLGCATTEVALRQRRVIALARAVGVFLARR